MGMWTKSTALKTVPSFSRQTKRVERPHDNPNLCAHTRARVKQQ